MCPGILNYNENKNNELLIKNVQGNNKRLAVAVCKRIQYQEQRRIILLARQRPTDLTHLVEWRRSQKVKVSPGSSSGGDFVAEIKEKALLIQAKGKSEDAGGRLFCTIVFEYETRVFA